MVDRVIDRDGCAGARWLDGLTAVSVRMLSGDSRAQDALLAAGLGWVNVPGEFTGEDPIVAWRSPSERMILGRRTDLLQQLQAALAPGRHDTVFALDLSEATAVLEMSGPLLDDWLARLVDACAIPREGGRGGMARLVDVPTMLLRLAPDRVWLVVERPLVPYVTDWLHYTHGAMTDTFSEPAPVS